MISTSVLKWALVLFSAVAYFVRVGCWFGINDLSVVFLYDTFHVFRAAVADLYVVFAEYAV